MIAQNWLDDGFDSAESFNAHGGNVVFARAGDSMYIQLDDSISGGVTLLSVESKEFIRMAHWIIKEFG